MTDEQIIKYWNEIDSEIINEHGEEFDVYITMPVAKSTVGLINRQKARTKELEERISYLEESIDCSRKEYNRLLQKMQQLKSEAIKEFAEQLKETAYSYSDISGYRSTVVDADSIDNLIKEMTEVQK